MTYHYDATQGRYYQSVNGVTSWMPLGWSPSAHQTGSPTTATQPGFYTNPQTGQLEYSSGCTHTGYDPAPQTSWGLEGVHVDHRTSVRYEPASGSSWRDRATTTAVTTVAAADRTPSYYTQLVNWARAKARGRSSRVTDKARRVRDSQMPSAQDWEALEELMTALNGGVAVAAPSYAADLPYGSDTHSYRSLGIAHPIDSPFEVSARTARRYDI